MHGGFQGTPLAKAPWCVHILTTAHLLVVGGDTLELPYKTIDINPCSQQSQNEWFLARIG